MVIQTLKANLKAIENVKAVIIVVAIKKAKFLIIYLLVE